MKESNVAPRSSDRAESSAAMNSHARMFEMIAAFKISQIIRAVCVHSLVEHLDNGLSTPTQIAEASNLDVDATDRLMRACVSVGLMTYDSGTSTFAATPVLLTLRADDPASLRSYALAQTADSHWLPWGRLDVSIKTGEPQAVATLGCNLWEYFSRFPTEGAIFSDAMRSASVSFDREVGKLVETRAADVVVDVGGASGSFVHALMEANSSLNGVVFDRQEVADAAMHAALKRGLASRFSTVSGDFFSDALPPADVYLLKLILHDWDDAACIEILRNCRRSIRAGGRLIVAEMIVGEPGDARFNPLIDLTMMVVLGGRERSIDQFRALFSATGFALTAVKPSSTRFWLIEAEAV